MKIFLAFVLFLSFATSALAQHCPFDGGEMLVVELRDQNDELIFGAAPDLTLVEIDNPNASACKYSPGPLELELASPVEAFMAIFGSRNSDQFTDRCADCAFNRDGFYAVVLDQGKSNCALKNDKGDIRWQDRKYELRYRNGIREQTIPLESDNFFSLCTGTGKWSRIVPVKLKVDQAAPGSASMPKPTDDVLGFRLFDLFPNAVSMRFF